MGLKLRKLKEIKNHNSKTIILRIDTDVDIVDGKIIDDTRLFSSLQTLSYLLEKKAKIVIIGHLGRPSKQFQISNFKFQISDENKEYSLKPIAKWFEKQYKGKIEEINIDGFSGWKISDNLFLLENIRFYEGEDQSESKAGKELSKKLAGLADLFVNEAFAVVHRDHVSVAQIAKLIPSFAGFHLEKEIEVLSKVIENPKRPLIVVIGGAKIETKLPMVERMHHIADYVLVGGEIAEQDKVLIKVQHEKVNGRRSMVFVADVKENGLDITDKSIENFIQVINSAKMIVWNGPVGKISSKFKVQSLKFDENQSEYGTWRLAEAIAKSNAYKVVGGGDTLVFLKQLNLLNKFDFVSTGGGAMLEFLSGKKLPGIEPLLKR